MKKINLILKIALLSMLIIFSNFYYVQSNENSGENTNEQIEDGIYKIVLATAPSQSLTVDGGKTGNGANVHLWQYVNSKQQQFNLVYDGKGYYEIIPIHSGKRLDVAGWGNEANVDQWQQNGGNDNQKWIIYKNSKGNYKTGVEYNGQYSPNELPQHLTQNFGLVWDGSSSETCNGKFGNYMKYNNPHKVSLYLSSGIPVVIWRHAALAKFIVNNHLGIAVDSLQEMDERVAAMSESEYNTYKTNAIKISGELRSGEFIKKAVIKIEEQVQ